MNLTVESNVCITPESADKSVYYLTLKASEVADSNGTDLSYQAGDWLTIQPENPLSMVEAVLNKLSLSGEELVEVRRAGTLTAKQALQSHIELTQLNPAILNKLQRKMNLGNWQNRQDMMDYSYGRDILDLLNLFPSLQNQGIAFLECLSPLAPRYYSIASAPLDVGRVSILYKAVQYQTEGRQRYGVASTFLSQCEPAENVTVEIKHNPTFKLPADVSKPVVMIGAGTGLAPYIGFMQQREYASQQGKKVGENLLFFGETYQHSNCLFCESFDNWQKQGLVKVFYAFSRDQKQKVYVQHRMAEHADKLWDLIENQAHFYICGSQLQLGESVKMMLLSIFKEKGRMNDEQAQALWQSLRKEKRLQLDLY